jgi:uncharacterized protein YciU (UPF0263 family)
MILLLAATAFADTVCEVPVPSGLAVTVGITYESGFEQTIQVSNSGDLTDAAVFSSAAGDTLGLLWSETGFTFRAVHEVPDGPIRDSECRVQYNRGEVVVGFEDSTDGDYNDVLVTLRPDPNACVVPVPAGTEVEAQLEYDASFDQVVQIGTGRLSPSDVLIFESAEGDLGATFTAPGPLWFRSVHFEDDDRVRSNLCEVRRIGDTMVVGFEDSTDGDYDDVLVTLRRP